MTASRVAKTRQPKALDPSSIMMSFRSRRLTWLSATLYLAVASAALGKGDDRLVGIWARDEGFQMIELLFRSDGRYQLDTKSTDPDLDFSSSERGRYQVTDQ